MKKERKVKANKTEERLKKKKTIGKHHYGHSCKSPQQNSNKQNPKTFLKDHTL